MRKSIILLGLVCLCITGCDILGRGTDSDEPLYIQSNNISVPVASGGSNLINETDEPVKVKEKVKYNDYLNRLKAYTYIELEQRVENRSFNSDGTEGDSSESVSFDLKYDTKSNRYIANFGVNTGTGIEKFSVKNDFKNLEFYSKEEGGKWKKSEESATALGGIDAKNVKNAYDVVNQLLKSYIPKEGTRGYIQDNKMVFESKKKATENDINGTNYDELLDKIVKVYFDNKTDKLSEVRQDVSYIVNGESFTITTRVVVKELSEKKLKLK